MDLFDEKINIAFNKNGLRIIPENPFFKKICNKPIDKVDKNDLLNYYKIQLKITEILEDKPKQEAKIHGGGLAIIYSKHTKQENIERLKNKILELSQ